MYKSQSRLVALFFVVCFEDVQQRRSAPEGVHMILLISHYQQGIKGREPRTEGIILRTTSIFATAADASCDQQYLQGN